VFGHWAALGLMVRDNVLCLDSGCVWGNKLSAVLLTADPAQRVITQVSCSVNHPGKARSFLKHSKARD
jgi:bis(5'-nucleosyl)-tetraphosphatase (symmetrical)